MVAPLSSLSEVSKKNEKEVIVAGPAPKCHHREADSAEGG